MTLKQPVQPLRRPSGPNANKARPHLGLLGLTLYATQMNLYNLIFRMDFLIVRYINKMATDGGGGAVDGRHWDDCKRDIGPWLKSLPGYIFFSLIIV